MRLDFVERFDLTDSPGLVPRLYNVYTFTDIYKFSSCQLAAVEVRDGGTKYSPLIGAYCNEFPNSTFTTDNMLHLHFFTNVEDPRNGFKAKISLGKS